MLGRPNYRVATHNEDFIVAVSEFKPAVHRLITIEKMDRSQILGLGRGHSEAFSLKRQLPDENVFLTTELDRSSEAMQAMRALTQLIQAFIHQSIERSA